MADTIRIKRRNTGNAGAPTSLAAAELAYNEVDNILYYGRGNNAGQAVTIIPIAGPGFGGGGGASISVSDTPPASPTDNMLWWESDTGILWIRFNDGTSTQWTAISAPPATGFLPLTGGTLTGWLNIQPSGDAQLDLRKSSATNYNILWGKTGTSARWAITLGDNVAESGSNAGSNFNITSWNDSGGLLATCLTITRSTNNAVFGNNLTLNGAYLTFAGATPAGVNGTSNGPLIYADQNNIAFHLGTGVSSPNFLFQNSVGANVAWINSAGAVVCQGQGQSSYTAWDTNGNKGGCFLAWDIGVAAYNGGTIEFAASSGQWRFAAIRGMATNGANNSTGVVGFFVRVNSTDATLTKKGEIASDGVWYNTNASWSALSDRSLKKDISPYTNGLAAIQGLQPVNFTYLKDSPFADSNDTRHIGLVAQDAAQFVPEFIGEYELNPMSEESHKVATLTPGLLVFTLINAVKELSAEVEALKARLIGM